jgi:diguanylate cyclase (GGDEF)-like protein
VAFFAVNLVLTTVATALREGLTVVQTFGRDLGFHTLTGAVLLSLGTIVAAVVQLNLALVPLILVPLAAVYKSQSVYLAAEHQALHDPLTGLPNRALFRDRVQQAIFATQRTGQPSAVIWIDLDRFKEVNDTLGHSTGDRLLVEMAARLTDTLRDSDTIARLGGDEFGVVLRGVANHVVAEHVADKLQAAIARPFVFDELVVTVESSFGLALAPDHGQDAETLVGRADSAMFVAKRSRSHRETYMPEHDRDAAERLTLLTGLRQAMESDELVVHYQPKIELGTGSIDGVEALVRWASPHRGLVAPDQFIPQAEQTAVIRRLSRAVLDKALGQVAWWHRRGVSVPVAVNLSTRDVQDPALPGEIAELLAKWLLGPQWLELEITESAVMADPTRTLEVLSRLRAAGVSLTIDDFGIGNTSLAKLNRLPVDTLKIDKSFVSTMATDAGDAAIVRTTCDLGHSLGLWVVAEGVESESALRQLHTLECDAAQGFYLGRPLPPEELDEGLLHGECLDVIELTGDEATRHPAAGEAREDQQDNQQSDVPSRTALTP